MKFNIYGFKQDLLVSKYNTLNGNDLIVLRVMVDMLPRMTRVVKVEGKEFKQVDYDLLLQDVPFVTQSTSTLKKIVTKLIDVGLIERYIVNRGGKFPHFRTTEALVELEYVAEKPVDSNGKKPVDGQVHFTEVEENVEEVNKEAQAEFELRVELIEEVLKTRANNEIKSQLARFRSQEEFFKYFDNFILPEKEEGKLNSCGYMLKNLKMYFDGKLN